MKSKGILLPVFSLPSRYGIGDFGAEAYKFVDFLAETGQNIWQILPLNPTSFGDSPYQSPSAYAGNPYFIDLEALFREGLLTAEELAGQAEPQGNIDYARLYGRRYEILRLAFSRFDANGADFLRFCAQTPWLADYCDFMALKDKNGGRSWQSWPEAERRRGSARAPEGEAKFYAFLQFWFFRQWKALKGYANEKGIRIVGDLPIYVSADSADVWSQPAYFQLDENLCPTAVAGVPPDGFTPDGQLWGNPLYNWEKLEEEGFAWWIERFRAAFEMYDMVRVDHFRGFAAYFAVPFGDKTAKNGKWVQAPGKALFAKVKETFPAAPVWAEDLGYLDESVRELLAYTGYPGMKILQFAFDSKNSEYLPKNYPANCVAYTGTHDNMTSRQYLEGVRGMAKWRVRLCTRRKLRETRTHAFVRAVLQSRADTAVIPMQDYLELGEEARVNTPSTLGGNWEWRLPQNYRELYLMRQKKPLAR